MDKFVEVTLELLEGFAMTLGLFGATLVLALPFGLAIAALAKSRFMFIRFIIKSFVWIIRGTPLMLQIFIVYYIPGLIFKITPLARELAVIIAFIINYAAYFSEIYRGGIESIPKGQYEAGAVLGMSKVQIFFKIVLMQVVKRIVPAMSNEVITLVKDTSLARVIGVGELIYRAEYLVNNMVVIYPIFYAGLFYLIFNGLLSLLFMYVEKKLSYYKI